MRPEQKITAAIISHFKQLQAAGEPIWWLKVHGGPMQRAGVPDLLVCYRGRFVGMEVKAPGKRATGLQKHTLGRIVAAAGKAAVVRSVEQAAEILRELKEPYPPVRCATGHRPR